MISQQTNSSGPMLSDFSESLLQANNRDQFSQFTTARSENTLYNDYVPSANHNLSSVLSQIKDDGPAYSNSVKRGNLINQRKNNKNGYDKVSLSQQGRALKNDDIKPAPSKKLKQDRLANAAKSGVNSKNRVWPQWLLILFITTVAALSLFRLDLRTNEMEQSLNLYGARLKHGIDSNSDDLSPELTTINKTLQSVKKELQYIKTDYSALDKKLAASITNKFSPFIDDEVLTKDNLDVLKSEILTLKNELQTVNNKLVAINKDIKTDITKNNGPANKVPANIAITAAAITTTGITTTGIVTTGITTTGITTTGWVVNLASLTDKIRAEKVVSQLYEAGLFPLIQEVMVNGKRVYRLSVDGFVNRNEAELFAHQAGMKFGMKGGWIRKS